MKLPNNKNCNINNKYEGIINELPNDPGVYLFKDCKEGSAELAEYRKGKHFWNEPDLNKNMTNQLRGTQEKLRCNSGLGNAGHENIRKQTQKPLF